MDAFWSSRRLGSCIYMEGASKCTEVIERHGRRCQVVVNVNLSFFHSDLFSYLLNPYVFLPTLALSSSSLQSSLVLLTVKYTAEGWNLPSRLVFFCWHLSRSSVTCFIPSFSPLSHRPFELRPPSAGITAPHQWSSLTPRISTTINCEFSSHPSSRQRIHLIYYHSLHCFNHNRWWNSVDTSNMGSDVRLVHLIHPWYASQPIAAILDWPCLIWHRIPVYGGTSSLRCLIIFVRSSLWFSVWVSAFSIVPAHSRPFSFRFTFSYM